MKNILACLVLLSNVAFAQSDKSIVNSDVKEVKVFLQGAQVNRTFRTTLPAGVTQLAVENLSPNVDRNSITVSVDGDAMILSTSFTLDYLKEKKDSPSLKNLKDSLETLTDKLNEQNMLKGVYNEETAMLNANKSVGGANVGLTAENLHKAIDFYRQRMTEIRTKLLEVDKRIVKLTERIKKLNEQIGVEQGKQNQPTGTILVNVSAKQSTPVSMELSYFAQGASWRPVYDLRAKDVNSPIALLYKAEVNQNTGENWESVRVSLSTGNPTLGGTRPILQPWYLRYYEPVYSIQGAPEMQQRKKYSMSDDKAEAPAPAMSLNEVVVMQENQVVTEFDIQIPYTVMSDGKPVMMDIQSFNLPAAFSYFTSPKLDKDAFLVASITGWEKLNLIPGKANVYLEGSYVGESYINPAQTNDTLQLSFGRDKRIIVKRELVKDMNTTKYFGGNVEKEFTYDISVRNNKREAVTVTVEDQVPLTTDASIKISTEELANGNYKAETGMISWKLDIKPGETKKVRLGYKVKYPKDKVIGGL